MEKEFKNGDKVRIIGNTPNSEHKIGDIGILITLANNISFASVIVEGKYTTRNQEYYSNLEHYHEEDIITDVILEEEFILPEKWCIKSNSEEEVEKVLQFSPIKNCRDNESILFYRHYPTFDDQCTCDDKIRQGYTEITLNQFKKYVLKEEEIIVDIIKDIPKKERLFQVGDKVKITENSTNSSNNIGDIGIITEKSKTCSGNFRVKVGKRSDTYCWTNPKEMELYTEVKPLPFFKVLVGDEEDHSIFRVQNNEGNVFEIHDLIKGTNGYAEKAGTMRILSFRYNKAKDNICAITTQYVDYGIGIDKIEHVIDFKKDEIITDITKPIIPENESNLDKAKRLYPIGTEYITAGERKDRHTVTEQDFSINRNDKARINGQKGKGNLFANNKWAQILSKPEIKQESSLSNMLKQSEKIHNNKYNKIVKTIEKEETLLEKGQRLFPIGTRFTCLYHNNDEWEVIKSHDGFESIKLWSGNNQTIVGKAKLISKYRENDIQIKSLHVDTKGWVKILYNGYKVGDVFIQYSSTPFTITRLETIDGHEIAFYKHPNGNSGPHDRILIKNIKK